MVKETDDREIGGILERAFPGSKLQTLTLLNGGVSARATQVTLLLPSGELARVVVRRPRAPALAVVRREHALLTRLKALGILAPAPCFLDETAGAVVLEFVEGAPDFAPADLRGALEQMAEQLALIHAVPVTEELERLLEQRRDSAARQIAFRPEVLDASLDEAELRATVSQLWPFSQLNRSVLLHGDYWPGNLLFEAGKLASVLDWEEAELGDPLADVALARLDLSWAFGDEAAEIFTASYRRASSIDWTNLARWELCIALRPLGQLARWAGSYPAPPIARPDITPASMAEGHRRFVQRARARL
jgi:aminoglycoside phosphotransferase (APT) family kinase protein